MYIGMYTHTHGQDCSANNWCKQLALSIPAARWPDIEHAQTRRDLHPPGRLGSGSGFGFLTFG